MLAIGATTYSQPITNRPVQHVKYSIISLAYLFTVIED